MEKPVRRRHGPATVPAPLSRLGGRARESGRQPARDVQPPRVKGNGISMITRLRPLLLAVLAAIVLGACTPSGSPNTSPASLAPAFPLTLTDAAGRSVTIPSDPLRIVSLAPSNTEIVCALDACHRLVGVTDFDDYPAQVADIPKVVIAAQVDLEKVVAAEPDLVLAAGNELTPSSGMDALAELGLPVLVLYPATLEEVYQEIHLVGAALDAREVAETVVADMLERADAVARAGAGAGSQTTPRGPALDEHLARAAHCRRSAADPARRCCLRPVDHPRQRGAASRLARYVRGPRRADPGPARRPAA